MKIYETKDYQEMSRQAANILSAQVILKPVAEQSDDAWRRNKICPGGI